uniref:Uncharacterized protein n=1 Tax=Avena sativa TaxID=4498 RepID=A0ACD6AK29_AVESA
MFRQQGKRLTSLEMELAAAKNDGFVGKYTSETNGTHSRKKPLIVIGIMTSFGRKNYRDAVRKSWLPTGSMLKKLEDEKGIVVRFIVGRSANRGDSFDREIDDENRSTNDFLILDDHIESDEELPKKTKSYFANAAETFDAVFYAKVNDDIYINVDGRRCAAADGGGALAVEFRLTQEAREREEWLTVIVEARGCSTCLLRSKGRTELT